MTFTSTIHRIKSVLSYADADKYFNSQPARRGKAWQPHQRPLRSDSNGARLHHYRIEKHDDGAYYDLVLYRTVMARYHRPEADGAERRLYMGDASITSKQYMWHVLGKTSINYWHPLHAPNERVVVPIYNTTCKEINENQPFTLDMYLVNGLIDTSRSRHTRHFVRRASATDKEDKAKAIKQIENFILMAQMRMPEYIANVSLDHNQGKPFSGETLSHSDRLVLQQLLLPEPPQHAVERFFEIGQSVFDVLASKRGYAQTDFTLHYRGWRTTQQSDPYSKLEKPITPEEFRKSLLNKLSKALHLDNKSDKIEIPQFVVEKDFPVTAIRLG